MKLKNLGVLAAAPLVLLATACAPSLAALPTVTTTSATPSSSRPQPAASSATEHTSFPTPSAAVAVTSLGWGSRSGRTWVTAVLHNTGKVGGRTTVSFTAFGSQRRVLALGTSTIDVRSGETTALGMNLDVPEGEPILRVSTNLRTATLVTPNRARTSTAGINIERSGRRLLGTVTSDATTYIAVTAVCYDTAGRIIGGGSTDVGSLTPGAASTFQIDNMTVTAAPRRCAVYTAVR